MPSPAVDSLFELVKSEALPGVWSRGVALARDHGAILDAETSEGFVLRVKVAGKAVAAKVEVWPGDEDVHCDCGDQADPCVHAVAAVVAIKNGWAVPAEAVAEAAGAVRLVYRFREVASGDPETKSLAFERIFRRGLGQEEVFSGSLVALVAGSSSGRLGGGSIFPGRDDFKVEQVLDSLAERGLIRGAILDRRGVPELFRVLEDVPRLEFGGGTIAVQSRAASRRVVVRDAGAGIVVSLVDPTPAAEAEKHYVNGIVLADGVLRPAREPSAAIRALVGRRFVPEEFPVFVAKVLPELRREFEIAMETSRLPELAAIEPRIFLEMNREPGDSGALEVLPRLVYGDPIVAEVIDGEIVHAPGSRIVPVRDETVEKEWLRKLSSELHLRPRQRVRMFGSEAIEFVRNSAAWSRTGGAVDSFRVDGALVPKLRADERGLEVNFQLAGQSGGGGEADPPRFAESSAVISAWNRGESLVPLLGGAGWAKIPEGWLRQHGDLLERFLLLRNHTPLERVQLADFVVEAGGEVAADLSRLRAQFLEYRGLPAQRLPADLRAELRPYQKTGVDWLGFLRDAGLGGLLADDMGLGKTLQALCAIRGRTLVIAPTSVLPAWESQMATFRPELRVNVYYGSSRKLSSGADVLLTSYGTLRQDRALLTAETWDSIVLDEAQQIKNPDSQIAKVVHALRGKFRIGLTGTPIENRLDDLWSQIEFVQPGLLGTRQEFQSRLDAGAITERLGELKRKVKPLILRRMKRDVAPELPPKTEVVLYSDLSSEERVAYQALHAATQAKVVQELEAGGSVLGVLEALLRLRQVCAHPALVPGFAPRLARDGAEEFLLSSKLALLRDQVEESLALGHSILIFSQWTSFLDLVEKVLRPMGVEYLRLDGGTPNRGELIEKFQDPAGPRVMILSLKAGGVGLTLTKADHVIILDPWWNPAVEDQAADRAHRIGQTQPVLVQRLVARDTVEDRILQLQKKKREIAAQVLGTDAEGAAALELTREDLLELLK